LKNKNHIVVASLLYISLMGCQTTSAPPLSESSTQIAKTAENSVTTAQPIIEEKIKTPQEVDDLWQRIEMQLALPINEHRAITQQLKWYKRHPAYIKRVSKRAEPYLYFIVEEIEKRNMPLEIALLPIVESAFDPFAYSHGAASGMWQIISGTGKRYGLEQNWWYDGRRDVIAATTAALDYLQYLHKYFKGDWLHALAAYNSGEGRVGRAIKKNRRLNKPTDFWSLKLPKETKNYVPKLLALSSLLKNSKQHGINWPTIDNVQKVAQVSIESQMDLALAAKLADIELKDFYQLNPGFNRWATSPNNSHKLLLPVDKVETFSEALAKTSKDDRLKWTRYKIKSGDTLGAISRKFDTTSAIIRQTNNVKGSSIQAGDFLLIPIASTKLSDYQLSADSRLNAKQNTKYGKHKISHLVQSGDNLWDIARKYKVNHRNIAKWNGIAPTDNLKLGKKLVIWLGDKNNNVALQNRVYRKVTYKVRNGDSIARIAKKFNVRVKDVVRWNALNIKKYLKPGQRLTLRVDVTKINT